MNITSSRADLKKFCQNGCVLDKADKLHLIRSSLSRESSTVVHRWLFNRLIKIKFNGKMKEKSICCSLTLKLTGMESVYFAACNFKTTDKSGLNLGIFQRVYKNFRME